MARRPRFLFWPIWENFASVLRSPEVWRCLMNSTIVATGTTILGPLLVLRRPVCSRATALPGQPLSVSGSSPHV